MPRRKSTPRPETDRMVSVDMASRSGGPVTTVLPPAARAMAQRAAEGESMFERLARDPSVSIEKMQALLEMHERMEAAQAKKAFDAAFAKMLPQIPTITETASTDKTTYAPLEEIVEQIKPVLGKHGFAISWQVGWPEPNRPQVTCSLTHVSGHARQSVFISPPDQSGSKNAIQALGSTITYGKRYTLKDLLAIVTREEDDDGQRAGSDLPEEPQGYRDFVLELEKQANQGHPALSTAWAAVNENGRVNASIRAKANHLVTVEKARWERIKTKALTVSKGAQ